MLRTAPTSVTLLQLRSLVAIVDAGLNVTAAAQRLNATQPGLSKQVRQMEDSLGLKLFARRGRSFDRLTETGAEVVERARVILSEAAGIQALAAERQDSSELRIATTHTQARFVLPSAVARLRARNPDIRLHLAAVGETEALWQLDHDAADLALVSGPARPITSHVVLPIYRWSLVGLCPRGRASPIGPITLQSLSQLPLVTYESAVSAGSSVSRAFSDAALSPQIACTARDSDLIKAYVRAGLGFGLVAEMAVTANDGDLVQFDLRGLFTPRTTWAVFRRDRGSARKVLELLAELSPQLDTAARQKVLSGEPLGDLRPAAWSEIRGY